MEEVAPIGYVETALLDAQDAVQQLTEEEGDSEELRAIRGHLENSLILLKDRDRRLEALRAADQLAQSEQARREASVLRESQRLEEEHAALLAQAEGPETSDS